MTVFVREEKDFSKVRRTADISMRNVEKTSQKTTLYLKSSHLPPHQWMIRVKSNSDNDLTLYESDSESDSGSTVMAKQMTNSLLS